MKSRKDLFVFIAALFVAPLILNFALNIWVPPLSMLEQKFDGIAELKEPVDILIIGDSSCLGTLSPRVIQKVYGLSAYNACMFAYESFIGAAWVLNAYLKKFPPPKLVVANFYRGAWTRKVAFERFYLPSLKYWGELRPWGMGAYQSFILIYRSWFPLLSYSHWYARGFRFPWLKREFWDSDADGFATYPERDPKSYAKGEARDRKAAEESVRNFQLPPVTLLALGAFKEFVEAHPSRLVLSMGPYPKELLREDLFKKELSLIEGYFGRFSESVENIFWLGLPPFAFPEVRGHVPGHPIGIEEEATRYLFEGLQKQGHLDGIKKKRTPVS